TCPWFLPISPLKTVRSIVVQRKNIFKMKSSSALERRPIDSIYILDLTEVEPGIYLVEYPNALVPD
ncbi:hypothetical protein MO867_19665, partial [Microbulbifer sp. OS29]